MEEYYKLIARNIEEAIKQSGLKQSYIADKMEVSPAYITMLKKGKKKPTVKQLYEICKITDVSADEIMNLNH